MARTARFRLLSIAILAAVAGGAISVVARPDAPAPIEGVVRATELRVAPEVGGHLAAVHVRKGARVKRGDVLAELLALELTALVE